MRRLHLVLTAAVAAAFAQGTGAQQSGSATGNRQELPPAGPVDQETAVPSGLAKTRDLSGSVESVETDRRRADAEAVAPASRIGSTTEVNRTRLMPLTGERWRLRFVRSLIAIPSSPAAWTSLYLRRMRGGQMLGLVRRRAHSGVNDMKHRPVTSIRLLLPIIGASLAVSVHAADPEPRNGISSQPGSTSAGGAEVASKNQRNHARAIGDVRLSKLIGTDVRNPRGEDLGDIKDLVIDSGSQEVRYAVIEFGGLFGMGEKLFAFPLIAFSQPRVERPADEAAARKRAGLDNDGVRGDKGLIGTDRTATGMQTTDSRPASGNRVLDNDGVRGDKGAIGSDRVATRDAERRDAVGQLPSRGALWGARNELVLNVNKEQLEDAPGFENRRWPDFSDVGFRSQIDRYWSSRELAARGAGADANNRAAQAPEPTTIKPSAWRASELLDAKVVGEGGKDIGEIEDVVVDANTGKLRYAVLAFEKGWFEADKLVVVPPKSLIPQSGGRVSFSGRKEQLAEAPAFDRKQWPELNETGYRSSLDRFLGCWN